VADNAWEDQLIADLKAHGGRPSSGPLAGQPLVIMYSTGSKSGQRRRSILTYSKDGDDLVVAGTNRGMEQDPAWIANVRADPNVTLELGDKTVEATAKPVEGAERDRLWASHVEQLPWFGKYEEQVTARQIPVVKLTPNA